MKMWYYQGKWHLSTNGVINAFNAKLDSDLFGKDKTFGCLFVSAQNYDLDMLNQLNPNYTYMFELVSPYNKIVVNYPATCIYHIGTRDNTTLKEINTDIGIKKPKKYEMKTENQVKEAASKLPFNEEGYVIVDKDYHRVKIKSPEYVNAHRLVSNGTLNRTKILDMIRENEQFEFLSYFPEYDDEFNEIQVKYKDFQETIKNIEKEIKNKIDKCKNKKEFALWIMDNLPKESTFAFMLYDNKVKDYKEFIDNLSSDKIIERI